MYINSSALQTTRHTKIQKVISTLFAVIFVFFGAINFNTQDSSADFFDDMFFCRYAEDNPIRKFAQFAKTDEFHFKYNSRSVGALYGDRVDGGMFNMLLGIGMDRSFEEKNTAVLGRNLSIGYADANNEKPPVEGDEGVGSEAEEAFNQGKAMNPYDRFGVAGLNFSNYNGEWKYLYIDICNGENINDPQFASYYEGRIEPETTYDNRTNSRDNRVLHHAYNKSPITSAMNTSMANVVFTGTKIIVVGTLSLINLAFSDLNEIMGINKIVAGSDKDGSGGIYQSLHQNLYMPLVVLMFLITAGYIFWTGIVKRRVRDAFGSLAKSIVMFFIAIIAATNAQFFTSLPNNAVVASQAFIVSAMSEGISGGNNLCKIGEPSEDFTPNDNAVFNTRTEDALTFMQEATETIKSSIGCSIWQQFLFKPWVESQFGTDFNNLWANDNVPDWATGGKELGNSDFNAEMVGDAAVPMGGGTFMHNWALFHLSTQTNAHSFIGKDGQYGPYTSEIANDWWRIADALSNYEEEEEISYDSSGSTDVATTIMLPMKTEPSPYWDTWVGANYNARMGTVLTSAPIAMIGLAVPMLFAGLSAIYGIGLTLLMAFAPMFFLFGIWPGKGWEIFKGWGQMVVVTMVKRIVIALLLMLSLILMGVAINVMQNTSWWQGILLMVIASYGLWKAKDIIIQMFARIQFSQFNMQGVTSRISGRVQEFGKNGTRMMATTGAGVARGMYTAKKNNISVREGARVALKGAVSNEIRNMGYRNKMARAYDMAQRSSNMQAQSVYLGDIDPSMRECYACGSPIEVIGVAFAFMDAVGNIYCNDCGDDDNMLNKIGVDKAELREIRIYDKLENMEDVRHEVSTKPMDDALKSTDLKFKPSRLDRELAQGFKGAPDDVRHQVRTTIDNNAIDKAKMVGDVAGALEEQIAEYHKLKRGAPGAKIEFPNLPREITPYANLEEIGVLWQNQNYEKLRAVYASYWAQYLFDSLDVEIDNVVNNYIDRLEESKGIKPRGERRTYNGSVDIKEYTNIIADRMDLSRDKTSEIHDYMREVYEQEYNEDEEE